MKGVVTVDDITPDWIQFSLRVLPRPPSWDEHTPYRDGYWNAVRRVGTQLLRCALQKIKGNNAEAVRILGIRRRLLYEKMTEFGLGEAGVSKREPMGQSMLTNTTTRIHRERCGLE